MQQQQQEKAYQMNNKVPCHKHPSKSLQYFCQHPQCTERLFCSSCLLKKHYCRHDINTYIVDIAEYMYQQMLTIKMKGLSKETDIHDYLINKESRQKMYNEIVDGEINRFSQELTQMMNVITKTIQDLKNNVKNQLQEFKNSYEKTQQMMIQKVEESFSTTYLAKFNNFEDVIASKDTSTSIGLRELLEKLTFEGNDESKAKDIRKYYENLISMHDQTPEIDYARFQSIKSYFNVFENKLGQVGPLLITLQKNGAAEKQKQINSNALLEVVGNMSINGIKKMDKSTSFTSYHTRTVYTVLNLEDRKIITGSDDGSVNIFDLITFENVGSHQLHSGGIRSMILVPGNRLVTGSYDKTIKIWPQPFKLGEMSMQLSQVSTPKKNAQLMTPLKNLTGHTSSIISLKYLNDGFHFASGSADYSIKVWDIQKGQNTKNYNGHMSDVLCLDCTSIGQTLISGSADRTIKIWSLTKKYSSACLKTLTGHLDFIWTIVLLQDDVTVLSGGLDKTIKIWDIKSGNLIRNLPVQHSSHITKIIQFTKDIIATCSNDGGIKFWDFKGNLCIHTIQLNIGISTMTMNHENAVIAVGQDKNIYLCD